jgi:peptidyl-prolyl cis-trans isomerase D
MLQKIREKVTGWIAGIILALLAFVFAVWGIDIGFGTRNVAAVVNGEDIPIAPVRQAIQLQTSRLSQQLGAEVPDALAAQVRDDVIEDFVRQRLLLQRVRDEGYRISDADLQQSIREMPVFQVAGRFSMDSYRAMLANVGLTPTGFEAEQRQVLEIGQLQDGILRSAFTTVAELERQVRLDREQREIEWIRLPVSNYLEEVQVTDEQIAAEYESAPDRYQSTETVDVEYLELSLDTLAAGVEVTDEEVRQSYDEQLAREPDLFRTPEQRRTRHILVAVDADTDEAAAEARADELLARVRGGEDFAEVAEEASDDTGSASEGGDLGWVEQGVMVAPFEEALFAMADGEIVGPVKTPFGYHVILLEETRPGQTRGFDEARAQIAEDLRRVKAEDIYYERADTLERFAFDQPDTLQPAADELGLEIRTVPGVKRTGNSGIAADPQFTATAFSTEVLGEGENSAALEIEEGRAIVLRVAEHHPAERLPLAEVRDRIRAELERKSARELAGQAAEDVRRQLVEGAAPGELAVAFEGVHEEPRMIGRQEREVPLSVRTAAFAAPAPEDGDAVVQTVALADGSQVIFRLTDVRPGDVESVPVNERRTLRDELVRRHGGEELTAYMNQVRSEANVVVQTEQFE